MNNLSLLPLLTLLLVMESVPVTETVRAYDPLMVSSKRLETGEYTAYHENGTRKFVTVYRKNKITGEWKSWYPSGRACDSGRFTGNVPDGEWKGWYPDGSLRYSWHLSATKLNALKDELLRQPKTKMFVIAQKPVADAVRYYQADYLFNQQPEKPRVTFRSQLVNVKGYDIKSLEKKVDHNTVQNKEKYVPPFPEMLLHGEFRSFHPGGKLKEEGVYINGLREGAWEEYAVSGEKSRGTYHHGHKAGEWRTYNAAGKLLSYTHYKSNGEVSETHEFSSSSTRR